MVVASITGYYGVELASTSSLHPQSIVAANAIKRMIAGSLSPFCAANESGWDEAVRAYSCDCTVGWATHDMSRFYVVFAQHMLIQLTLQWGG